MILAPVLKYLNYLPKLKYKFYCRLYGDNLVFNHKINVTKFVNIHIYIYLQVNDLYFHFHSTSYKKGCSQ